MCASATAILHWNAIPVFADIDPVTFCLDPESVEANITSHTKAIMAVDIFGQSADMDALMAIAKRHGLKVISDTAQARGAMYKGKYAGTLADVGGFSLNYHKHIHTGEGGILVTNDDQTAKRLQLIRNHAEAVVEGMGVSDLTNMVGYNFRLGEIECAIGIAQMKKLQKFVNSRQKIANQLSEKLANLPGLKTPSILLGNSHVYYVYGIVLDTELLGIKREIIVKALEAEGVTGLANGYQNIHLLPIFQKKVAYGSNGFPWSSDICRREVSYRKGICPVAEKLHEETYLGFAMCLHDLDSFDVDQIGKAFNKVWRFLPELRSHSIGY
jgi:dTDP-4-amino-4,6-dideoxygalactose transaminase